MTDAPPLTEIAALNARELIACLEMTTVHLGAYDLQLLVPSLLAAMRELAEHQAAHDGIRELVDEITNQCFAYDPYPQASQERYEQWEQRLAHLLDHLSVNQGDRTN